MTVQYPAGKTTCLALPVSGKPLKPKENGLIIHEKFPGRLTYPFTCPQQCIKNISNKFLGVAFPRVENVRQTGEGPACVLAVKPLYPKISITWQGLVEPFYVYRIKTPAYQAQIARGMAERTGLRTGKTDFFAF
jgi:hypothetical protein